MSDERLKELSALATYQFAAIFNEKNMQMTIGEIVEKLYDIDLVRVVRCKDCIYGIENGELCGQKVYLCSAMTNPNEFYGDFYCANGERRETEKHFK